MTLALSLLLPPALALPVDLQAAETLDPVDRLPLVDVLPRAPFYQTHVWEQVAQPSRHPLSSLAISPDNAALWLAADSTGAVFLSDDSGARWTLVLPGIDPEGINDEALLLEAEAGAAEAFEGVDDADIEAETNAVNTANEDAAAQVQVTTASTLPSTVWFDRAGSGVALFGREGEIWRSADGGVSWARVDTDDGARAFARIANVIVAGGNVSVRASLDNGESWIDVDSAMPKRQVREFTEISGFLYAATDRGLYRSRDALSWSRVLASPDIPLVSTLPDPDYPQGLWVAAEAGLYRSDDGGESFFRFANQSIAGLVRMVKLPEVGHLLAIGDDGVWESTDGGVRWTPCSRLLTDPTVVALDFADGAPVIATSGGVWRAIRPERLADAAEEALPAMPLGDVVNTALTRSGMTGDLLALARRSRVTPLVPTLTLQFDANWGAGRGADFQVLASDGNRGDLWSANAQFCWGGCSSSTYYSYDSDSYDVQQLVDDGQLTVIDGKVYDDTSVVAAAANVAQRLATFRVSTASQISEAWLTRHRLVGESPSVAERALRDQVMHLLAIQELDARLDAWTNGAFSTWTPE